MLLILIFAVIILSGLIAYIGDQIGMKVGKKRLSIFGIRPKYTSIIITVLTGIMIATFSISLLMMASKGVRMAVFDMQKLLTELGHLNHLVHERDVRLKEMANEISLSTAALSQIETQKGTLQVELDQKTAEMAEKQWQYDHLQAEMKKAEESYADLARANMELGESKIQLEEKVAEIEHQKQELESTKAELEREINLLNNDVETLNGELLKLSEAVERAQQKALSLELHTDNAAMLFSKGQFLFMESVDATPVGSITDAVKVIQEYMKHANRFVQNYPVAIDPDGNSIRVVMDQFYALYRELLDSKNEKLLVGLYASKNIWANEYVDSIVLWERNYLVFQKDEIVIQKEIDAAQESNLIERKILDLLGEVRQRSKERGLLPLPSGEVGQLDLSDILDLTKAISRHSGKVKLTIRSTQNIWRDDILSMNNLRFEVEMVGMQK